MYTHSIYSTCITHYSGLSIESVSMRHLIKLSLRDILNQLHGFEIKTIVSSIKKHAGTRKAVKGD